MSPDLGLSSSVASSIPARDAASRAVGAQPEGPHSILGSSEDKVGHQEDRVRPGEEVDLRSDCPQNLMPGLQEADSVYTHHGGGLRPKGGQSGV